MRAEGRGRESWSGGEGELGDWALVVPFCSLASPAPRNAPSAGRPPGSHTLAQGTAVSLPALSQGGCLRRRRLSKVNPRHDHSPVPLTRTRARPAHGQVHDLASIAITFSSPARSSSSKHAGLIESRSRTPMTRPSCVRSGRTISDLVSPSQAVGGVARVRTREGKAWESARAQLIGPARGKDGGTDRCGPGTRRRRPRSACVATCRRRRRRPCPRGAESAGTPAGR